jgi:hypothetical protein
MSTISLRLGIEGLEESHLGLHAREVELMMGILLRILVLGGPYARSYMLNQMGLLSWLGGIFCGRPLGLFEKSKSSTMILLLLTRETLKVTFESWDDQWQHCLRGFVSPACRLWNSVATGSEVWNFTAEGLGQESVAGILTDILVYLSQRTTTPLEKLEANLVDDILSKMEWQDKEQRITTLNALLSFTVKLGEPDTAGALTKTLLDLSLSCDMEEKSLDAVMTYFSSQQKEMPHVLARQDLFELFCRLRPTVCRYESTRQMWLVLYNVLI